MKWLVCWLIPLLLFSSPVHSQHDKKLLERLDSMTRFTERSDFESILNLTYPKVFSIAPREQLLEAMEEAMENEEFSSSIDSLVILTIEPPIVTNNAQYVLISHSMLMYMKFREVPDSNDKEGITLLTNLMEDEFGKGNVRYNQHTGTMRIYMLATLLAIRDEHSPEWSFLNLDEDSMDIADLLLPEDVLGKIKTALTR